MREEVVVKLCGLLVDKVDENKNFTYYGLDDIRTARGIIDIMDDIVTVLETFGKSGINATQEESREAVARMLASYVKLGTFGYIPVVGKILKKKVKSVAVIVAEMIVGYFYRDAMKNKTGN